MPSSREALLSLLYAPATVDASRHARRCDCLAHRYGNAMDRPMRIPVCPTDLTDAQWAVVAPLIRVAAWMRGRGGRPGGCCHREMVDAMLYVDDNGTKWRALPADFPEWTATYRFFRRWRDQGLVTVLHDRLRRACRIAAGREPEPSAAVIDSQSLRAAETVAAADRGYDGGKRVNATKRHVALDVLALLLTVLVTGAMYKTATGQCRCLNACVPCACASRWRGRMAPTPVGWRGGRARSPRWVCRSSNVRMTSRASSLFPAGGWLSARSPGSPGVGAACVTTSAATTPTRRWCAGRWSWS